MESINEVREHIKSVKQTLKITNAMFLISSSKLRRARQQLSDVVPYFEKISSTISDILYHSPEIEHLYFEKRTDVKERNVGYIVITGDKGLAGAYNHNVLKLAEQELSKCAHPTLFLVGLEGRSYFAHKNVSVDGEFMYTVQDPTMRRAAEISDTFLELYRDGRLDEVYVIYTKMITPLRLEPQVAKLLPLDAEAFPYEKRANEIYTETVTYVPSMHKVLSHIAPCCVKGMIFGALVESYCSEQNARMTAMDASTKSARDMLADLSLTYNRARQASITQEITEIVGGAQSLLQN